MSQPGHPSSVKSLVIIILLIVVGIQGYLLWQARDKAGQEPAGADVHRIAPPPGGADASKPSSQGTGQATGGPAQDGAARQGPPEPAAASSEKAAATGVSPVQATAKGAPAPVGAVEAASIVRKGDEIYISFTKPVGEEESSGNLAQAPADITPPVPGAWSWMGPYILRFRASVANPFNPYRTSIVTLRPERFLPAGTTLSGRRDLEIRGYPLIIRDPVVEVDPVPGKAGQYVISIDISFSDQISPQQALKAFKLVDPKLGQDKPIPLKIGDQAMASELSSLRFVSEPVTGEAKPRVLTLMAPHQLLVTSDGQRPEQDFAFPVTISHSATLIPFAPTASREKEGSWQFTFSSKVKPEEFKRSLRFEPHVDNLSVVPEFGGMLMVRGSFQPGQSYTAHLSKGLSALDGASLEKDFTFTIKVPDLPPGVRFASSGMFLPRSGSRQLGLESVNARSAHVRIDRVYRNNIFFALNYYDYSLFSGEGYPEEVLPYLGDTLASFDIPLKAPRNQSQQTPFNFEEQVRAFEPGLYRVSVSADGQTGQGGLKWMLVTDLGLAAKRGHDDLLVWAASFKDGQPVPGARVRVVSTKNQTLFQGVTDQRGLWRASGLANLPEDKQPFMIVLEKDADHTFLHLEGFRTDLTGLDVSGVQVAQAGYQAFVWGERDIYRPGETVQAALCVRDAKLQVPPAMPVKLRWSDPQGREFAVENVRTGEQGLVFVSRPIPAHMPTGPYAVEVLAGDEPIGQYRFELEDFKPDRITTEIKPGSERAAPGQELAYAVEGRYLFGAPGAGLAVETQVSLTPMPFAPKGYEQYVFGDPERAFDPIHLPREQGRLDEEGKASFKALIPAGLKPPAALAAMVSARVSETGGRGVATRIKMLADAYPRYPGLRKLGESGLTPGNPQAFEYVVVDGLGQEAQAEALVAELYEDRWQTVLKRSEEGQGFKYETRRDSRLVERREIAQPGSKGQVSLTPPKFGSYRLVLREPSTGAAAQLSFWAEGQGYNPWAVENPARLEMVPNKTDYLPGETAKIQVRAPFPGKLLVTVESTGVQDVIVADMPANTGEILVPIKAGYGPNVYLTAVLARKGADVRPGEAGRAFGVLPVNVGREAGHQKVQVMAPGEIRPLTQLTLTAQADPGAVVTLAAVDEGILQLIAQKTPDPWGTFYAKRALEVDSFDTWAFLLPELMPRAAKSPAGGDDWSRYLRTESPQGDKSVAFWSGPLKADATGKVRWTIDVPRFQGALRVMAVAVSGNRFGSAQATTRVRTPLVLLPTFPRFAQTGETLKLPLTVRNDTASDAAFTLTLAATGAMSVQNGTRSLEVPKGRERTVFVEVRTAALEGLARLEAVVSGNGEQTQAATELFVRSPLPAQSRMEDGVNEGQEIAFRQASVEGLLPGTVSRDLHLGRTPLVRFSGKLADLLGYPYGCVEQTVSRVFPLLYFSALARELEPEALAKTSPEAMVQQGISRVVSLQQPSGGFGMWPGAESVQEWASVYAAHFLVEAAKAGFQPPKRALEEALGYLAGDVKAARNAPAGWKTQAYGLYVLALAGKPDRGMMDHLRDKQAANLPADAKALLAAAYAASGNPKGGERLLADLGSPQAVARTEPIFDSPLRAKALLTAGLVDAAPASPETAAAVRELIRALAAQRTASTQEAGMAFVALGKLLARQQAQAPCPGQVLSGQTPVASYDGQKTLTLKNLKIDGPLKALLDPGCQPGSLYYSLDTRGVPELSAYKPSADGLTLERQFLGRDGKPLDLSRLPQGTPVIIKTVVRSTSGPLANVVVSQLLPSGLEVENPRLATSDKLDWMETEPWPTTYADYRADRVNVFLDLDGQKPATIYTLCRAVIPGVYVLPPARAEGMYSPEVAAGTEVGGLTVEGGGQ